MYLHANAKLGLGGRVALVTAIERGLALRAAGAAFNVAPAAAHRWWHRWLWRRARSGGASRSLESPGPLAATACTRTGGAHLQLPARHRLGAAAGRWRHRLCPLDRL